MHSIDDEVVAECVQLVCDIAAMKGIETGPAFAGNWIDMAKVIVAKLPKQVDPDWVMAGEIAEDLGWPVFKRNEAFAGSGHELAYHAIKRARALTSSGGAGK